MPHSFDSQWPAGFDLKENRQAHSKGDDGTYSYADFPRTNTANSERSKRRYSSVRSDREGELSNSSRGPPSAKSRRRRIRSRSHSSRSGGDDREKIYWPRTESTPYYEGTPRERGCPDSDRWRPGDTIPRRGTPYLPGDTPFARGVPSSDNYRPNQLDDGIWRRSIRETAAEPRCVMPRKITPFPQSLSIAQVLWSSSNNVFESHNQYREAESSTIRGLSSRHSSATLPAYHEDNPSSSSHTSAEPCSSVLQATYYAATSTGGTPRALGNQEIAPFSPIQASNLDMFEYTSDCALLNKEAAFCSHSVSEVDEKCNSNPPRFYPPIVSEEELRLNQFMYSYRRYVDDLPSKPSSPRIRSPVCPPCEDDVEFELGPTGAQKAKKFREDIGRWWYKVIEPNASVVSPDIVAEDEAVHG